MPFSPAVLRSILFALAAMLITARSLRASELPAPALDPQALAAMEQRAVQANPREQCFLYAELVNAMAETAGRQLLAGDSERASVTLREMDAAEQHLHAVLFHDAKRLKNAEMLLHRTLFRMSSFLHAASTEDRASLQDAIRRMDTLHTELLGQVFSH